MPAALDSIVSEEMKSILFSNEGLIDRAITQEFLQHFCQSY